MALQVNDRWARLKCVGIEARETAEEHEDASGNKYPTGCFWSDTVYVLLCECGKTVEIGKSKFMGKRTVKDCGCGIGDEDAIVLISLTIPLRLKKALTQYADANGMKVSHAAVRTMDAGLKSLSAHASVHATGGQSRHNGD